MLWTPPNGFDRLECSQTSTSSDGTSITANASANTKGTTPTQIIAATSFPAYGIAVFLNNVGVATTNARMLVDIMIGAAASEKVILPDLNAGNAASWVASPNGGHFYFFPIYIPSGTRLSARCAASTGSDTVNVVLWLLGASKGPGQWVGQRVTAYGATAASSRGIAITPGSTNAYGTAASIVNPTIAPIRYLQVGLDTGTDTSGTSMRGMLRLGTGATPDYFVQHLPFGESTTVESLDQRMTNMILSQMMFNIPSGIQLQASMMVNGTGEARSIIAYGVD